MSLWSLDLLPVAPGTQVKQEALQPGTALWLEWGPHSGSAAPQPTNLNHCSGANLSLTPPPASEGAAESLDVIS